MSHRTVPPSPLLECLLEVGPQSTFDATMRAMPLPWLSACGHGVDIVREPGETDRNTDVTGCFMVLWGWFGPQDADGVVEVDQDVFAATLNVFLTAASTLALEKLGLFKVDPVSGWLDSRETLKFCPVPFGPQTDVVLAHVESFGLMGYAALLVKELVSACVRQTGDGKVS